MAKEYLGRVTGPENEESSPLQVFCSPNSIWVVQACLKKSCSKLLKLHMSSRAETAAGNQPCVGQHCLYSLCIGHPFYLGSNKCNMKISSVIREFSYAGCPVRLSAGRQQYVHHSCAASRVSGMISISVTLCCADSLHGIFLRESSSK